MSGNIEARISHPSPLPEQNCVIHIFREILWRDMALCHAPRRDQAAAAVSSVG
jgi:hypothetical protein